MAGLTELTATRLVELVRSDEVSRREVVQAHLAQIARAARSTACRSHRHPPLWVKSFS